MCCVANKTLPNLMTMQDKLILCKIYNAENRSVEIVEISTMEKDTVSVT